MVIKCLHCDLKERFNLRNPDTGIVENVWRCLSLSRVITNVNKRLNGCPIFGSVKIARG